MLNGNQNRSSNYKVITVGVVIVLAVIFSIVKLIQDNDAQKLCFVLEEGDVNTYLVIEDGEPNASITVIERRNGEDIEPPMTGPGTLEESAVVLVDGTRLEFNDTELVWPVGSLLAGSVFVASDCPTF